MESGVSVASSGRKPLLYSTWAETTGSAGKLMPSLDRGESEVKNNNIFKNVQEILVQSVQIILLLFDPLFMTLRELQESFASCLQACYDVREGSVFWARMYLNESITASNENIPEWLSTHPSHQKRVELFDFLVPKVC